jgi:LysM repeat protein/ABC-type branched-subunit amino acid transport system substrate-binding protein
MRSAIIFGLLLLCSGLNAQFKADTIWVEGRSYAMHTVEKGQTLFSLAKYYGASVDEVIAQNPDCAAGLKVGQVLKIEISVKAVPPTPISSDNPGKYVVKSGDTVYSISRMYGISADELRKLNHGLPAGLINGDTIVVPLEMKPVASEPADNPAQRTDEFDIVLMLPFFATYMDTMMTRDYRLRDASIQLYRGAMMAADSLEAEGLQARIHVLDVLDDKAAVQALLKKDVMKQADLVMGPLFKDIIPEVSAWCKEHDVHMVVPVQQPNRVLLNASTTSKTVPGSATQWMTIARYVSERHPADNVVLIDSKILDDKKMVEAFKEEWFRLKKDSLKRVVVFNDVASFSLEGKLTAARNIVLVPTADKKVIGAVFKAIGTKNAEVIGTEAWDDMDFISVNDRNKYHVHFPQHTFVDYSDLVTQQWIESFRARFKSEPTNFAFVGYDVLLFYGRGLKKFGSQLQQHLNEIEGSYLATQFNFFKTAKDAGYENAATNIVRTDNYQLYRVN